MFFFIFVVIELFYFFFFDHINNPNFLLIQIKVILFLIFPKALLINYFQYIYCL